MIGTVHTLELIKELVPDFEYKVETTTHCLRMTILSKKPLIIAQKAKEQGQDWGNLSTFTVPAHTFGNQNPIRLYQQNHHTESSPYGTYLILVAMQVSNKGLDFINEDRAVLERALKVLFGVDLGVIS